MRDRWRRCLLHPCAAGAAAALALPSRCWTAGKQASECRLHFHLLGTHRCHFCVQVGAAIAELVKTV